MKSIFNFVKSIFKPIFNRIKGNSARIIIYSFIFLILSGTFLLMLPISTQDGRGASFLDALFTATSASCVTGLVVQNTATYWTLFGQFVIMLLIQVGGMGVVTMAVAVTILTGRKISLSWRGTMQDAISAHQVGGIVRMTGFIIKMSLIIELIGALSFSLVFVPQFGLLKGLWYSIFHSVSAFCNAGFDLLGTEVPYCSLVGYSSNAIINITVMSLIVIGGLSFSTWADFSKHKLKLKNYHMQSKIILCTTLLLIVLPAVYFYIFEYSNPVYGDISTKERLLSSFFQSVTTRTAGFNTTDLTLLSESGVMIMIVLMIIGGSPGSTAGGMKTTTFAVLFLNLIATFKRKPEPSCFGRRIENDAVKNAATVVTMYVVMFLSGAIIISMIEGLPLLTCMFETASAIGTVGLTLGITTSLSSVSRLILIGLMYLGRVGGLTIIFATIKSFSNGHGRYPQEKITIG